VNDFVEECRREWRRLGVPDPIANEMAADLTADIEEAEAEAEGGSAEDVLGNSVFEPQRFAASWAGARGVTAPVLPSEKKSATGVVLLVAAAASAVLITLVAVALLVGHRSASAAVAVPRFLGGRGPVHFVLPGPPFRSFVLGAQVTAPHDWPIALFAALVVLGGLMTVGLAVLFWSPWFRRDHQPMARVAGRTNWPKGFGR